MPASLYLGKVVAALGRAEEVNWRIQRNQRGIWRLVDLAIFGHEAAVELLLQEPGLDVNLASLGTGRTALHWACYKGHAGIVRRLLAHPSLTCHNYRNSNGQTALQEAVFNDNVGCVLEMVAVLRVDLDMLDMDLEEMARSPWAWEAWEVVRRERGRRER